MKRSQPEVGDVVRMISDYAPGDATVPQYGDMGVVTDHEQDSNGLCWWIVQTFNGAQDGYAPSNWDTYFEIIEEK